MMDKRVTPMVRSTAKGTSGGTVDTYTDGAPVWASLTSPREARQIGAGRYEFPVTKVARVDHASWAVAGNRIRHGTTVYDILGADSDGDVTRLDLKEVTR